MIYNEGWQTLILRNAFVNHSVDDMEDLKMFILKSSLLQKILDKYGDEEQLLQTMGECGELVAVTQNYLRTLKFGAKETTWTDVMEEAVDVFFMIQQIRHMSPEIFDQMCEEKLKAVHKKLDNEGD